MALNCSAYIESIETDGVSRTPTLTELKWKNQRQDHLSIPPEESRLLDAFNIPSDKRFILLGLNIFLIDYEGLPQEYVLGEGEHTISYVIFSENFSPARIKLRIIKNGQNITSNVIT